MNFQQTLEMLIDLPPRISVLITGNHGLGKSDCVKLAASKRVVPCVDFRLGQCEVGDIKGYPKDLNGRMVWLMPEWFPLSNEDALRIQKDFNLPTLPSSLYGEDGYLFLDEINRGTRDIQQAAFELVLDYTLNNRRLPMGWRVVAAMNGQNLYNVTDMDRAFRDRFFVIEFKPTREEWWDWGRTFGRLHPAILNFTIKCPDLVDPTDDLMKANPDKKLFSRRSWEKFSVTISHYEQLLTEGKTNRAILGKSLKDLDFMQLVAQGFVGSTVGAQFRSFIATEYQSLDAAAILNKWGDAVEKRLIDLRDKKAIPEIAAYNQLIINYLQDNKIVSLTDKQSENLYNYIAIIPNEIAASFWTSVMKDPVAKVPGFSWYNAKTSIGDKIRTRLNSCFVTEKNTKKGAKV